MDKSSAKRPSVVNAEEVQFAWWQSCDKTPRIRPCLARTRRVIGGIKGDAILLDRPDSSWRGFRLILGAFRFAIESSRRKSDDIAVGLRHQEMKIGLNGGVGPSPNILLTLRDDCAKFSLRLIRAFAGGLKAHLHQSKKC